ncbi:MAG: phosphoglycerate kinase [Candidatus Gastranaerophilales bacterium]|nr:phosphoglycerate kinase [Candidatus Gastranaerophilales bacterium]
MKTVKDVDVKNKRVLVREDFDVPLSDGKIIDDSKIKEALPTIKYLKDQGAKIILMSDLGKPDGHAITELRMDLVAERLEKILNEHIENIDEIVGDSTQEAISSMMPGEILLVENLGFSGGEYSNNSDFARGLATLADVYVDDAFSLADKRYASNVGITQYLPSYAGLIMEKESDKLINMLKTIDHPFVLLIAGTNIEEKMSVIERFIDIADNILVAGLPALAFLKALGYQTGRIKISDTSLKMAKDLLSEAKIENIIIKLPDDFMVAESIYAGAPHKFVSSRDIPEDMYVVDIGPKTFSEYNKLIYDAELALWNGPVGVYEIPDFEWGSRSMAQSFASTQAKTIVMGQDTLNLINKFNKSSFIDILSNHRDIALKYLEGKDLPAIKVLEEF